MKLTRYSPEIAPPVESFKAAFDRTVFELIKRDEQISSGAKEELWRLLEGFYVDVLCSMHGWKSCIEGERIKSQQLFDSLVEMTNIYIEHHNLRPDDVDSKKEEKYQRAIDAMRLSGLLPKVTA